MKRYVLSKMNDEPLLLDTELRFEDDEETSLFFEYWGVKHYWDDIVSRRSAWFPPIPDLPDYIHGVDESDFWKPLFVEVVEVDIPGYEYEIALNVYEYLEDDDD